MNKTELIQVHGLLNQILGFVEEKEDVDIDTDNYDAVGVSPVHIHKSKSDHKEAVFALSEDIAAQVAVDAESGANSPSQVFAD